MKVIHQTLNLDQPATYQIKDLGRLDGNLSDWVEGMTITIESGGNYSSTTTLTGTVADQASLQGILRRLYSLGIPLISVNQVEPEFNVTAPKTYLREERRK